MRACARKSVCAFVKSECVRLEEAEAIVCYTSMRTCAGLEKGGIKKKRKKNGGEYVARDKRFLTERLCVRDRKQIFPQLS